MINLLQTENKAAVEAYKEAAEKQSDIERQSISREKTGVFTGSYAINPINGKDSSNLGWRLCTYILMVLVQLWQFQLMMKETMLLQQKYNLTNRKSYNCKDGNDAELPFTEYGFNGESGKFDGLND